MTHTDHHPHHHAGHGDHADRPPLPLNDRRALNRLSLSATVHCMTGCAIGEILGFVIATGLGWDAAASLALAIGLAFLFGYTLTSLPMWRAGLGLQVIVPIALAVDTLSITTMELVENATMMLVPGAMDASLGDALFWVTMLGGFVIAFPPAFVVNRALLRRGKGHALVHQYHGH